MRRPRPQETSRQHDAPLVRPVRSDDLQDVLALVLRHGAEPLWLPPHAGDVELGTRVAERRVLLGREAASREILRLPLVRRSGRRLRSSEVDIDVLAAGGALKQLRELAASRQRSVRSYLTRIVHPMMRQACGTASKFDTRPGRPRLNEQRPPERALSRMSTATPDRHRTLTSLPGRSATRSRRGPGSWPYRRRSGDTPPPHQVGGAMRQTIMALITLQRQSSPHAVRRGVQPPR
jgi:hypothetical protein